MKITLNIPDNMQSDLVKLGCTLEIPLEKVVVSIMGIGTTVITDNPHLQKQIKAMWAKEGK